MSDNEITTHAKPTLEWRRHVTRLLSRRSLGISAFALATAPAAHTRAASATEPLLLRCSLETAPTHKRNAVIRDYLANIESASDHRIKAQLFESGQLFPDLQVGKALLQDQIDMAVPGTWSVTGIVPDADFLQLPVFYGRSSDIVHRAADSGPGRLLARQIEHKLSAHVIGPWLDLGFFNWYSTSKPLRSYVDLKGLKIRNNGGAGQAWRTQFMGAISNTTPLPNVPLGLSQGTFDGLITTYETVASIQLWESGIHHALEDHQFIGEYIPIISLAFWQKLTPDLRQLFTDLWQEKVAAYRAEMASAQSHARSLVEEHGISIIAPSPEELAAMREQMITHQDEVARLSRISQEMPVAVSADIEAA